MLRRVRRRYGEWGANGEGPSIYARDPEGIAVERKGGIRSVQRIETLFEAVQLEKMPESLVRVKIDG